MMEKAQQEVRRVLEGRTKIEESDLEELHYLKLVMKESLRLHIPGPLLMPRVCKETCQVLGYRVPAGTRVLINAWALARDKRYWGPDVENFNPERFANNSIDYKGFNYEFLPFGSGRRVCPGMTFGLTSVETVLANLLLYFDWQLPNGMKPEELNMDENSGVTSSRTSPLFLLATPKIPLPTVEFNA